MNGIPPRPSGRHLVAADGCLVSVDFDGTLAPIVDDPAAATMSPGCRRGLERLRATRNVRVAVISGRALADVRDRVGLDGVAYAGNHGLELSLGSHVAVHPAAARARPTLVRFLDELTGRLADVPGWSIEDKGLSVTIHIRGTPITRQSEVRAAVATADRTTDGQLRLERAHQAVEVRPGVDWDKGSTMELLASRVPREWLSVFVGDGPTDEVAFRAVHPDGLGVIVGQQAETDAAHRLPSQDAVAPFLERVAREFRGGQD